MIGNTLITKQSGADGLKVNCVYVVEKVGIKKEFYLSITLDRGSGCPVFIYSQEGGMSIEDVAHATPEKIHKIWVDPKKGLEIDDFLQAAKNLGCED